MKKNNIILLDLDVVLIKSASWIKDEIHEDVYSDFHPTCVKALNKILEETGYYIILSSARRVDVRISKMNVYWCVIDVMWKYMTIY